MDSATPHDEKRRGLSRLRAWLRSTFRPGDQAAGETPTTPADAPADESPVRPATPARRASWSAARQAAVETHEAVGHLGSEIIRLENKLESIRGAIGEVTAELRSVRQSATSHRETILAATRETKSAVDGQVATQAQWSARLDQQQRALSSATEKIAELSKRLEAIPTGMQSVSDVVGGLGQRLERVDQRVERLASLADEVPRLAEKGAGSLAEIKAELQRVGQPDNLWQPALASVTQAVEKLGRQQRTHAETLQTIDTHAAARERMLTDLVDAQKKRFGQLMWLMVAALSVVLVMLVIQIVIMQQNPAG